MNHLEYVKSVAKEAIELHGEAQSLASKLIADVDSGSISEEFAENFIEIYKGQKNIDLVDLM